MKGFWNGEPAEIKGVTYEVTEPSVPTWWQACFIGKTRQGIEITYSGETWIIDNEHGDGLHKVTRGMGSPTVGHKSIENPINIKYIPDEELNVDLDMEALKTENQKLRTWFRDTFPEDFLKSEALAKKLRNRKIK